MSITPFIGCTPQKMEFHFFKPNFLNAASLAFALSCDSRLALLFDLLLILITASSSNDLVNDK